MTDSLRHHLSVAWAHARFSVQRTLEYPFSLLGVVASLSFSYIWIGITFKILVDNFQPLSGWTFPQLAFLYGLGLSSRGVMSILSFQSRQIDEYVTRGEFDRLLVRPLDVTFQFAASSINLVGFVHLGIGLGYFLYGAHLTGFAWSPTNLAKVLLVIAGGTLIYWSYFTLISCIAFWTKRSRPLVDSSMELLARGTFYPLTIYPKAMQLAMTFVLPIGFISFYPACDFLGQDDRSSLPLDMALLTPLVGVALFVAAVVLFRAGLRRYESAGS
jgi:ABC-2 type transport system permease protein